MFYLESNSNDPFYNLALEEYIFNTLSPGESVFFLWQNSNTIVIGNYQNTAAEINADYVRENGIKVARRITGGGAVYHDLGNLNYSIICEIGRAHV